MLNQLSLVDRGVLAVSSEGAAWLKETLGLNLQKLGGAPLRPYRSMGADGVQGVTPRSVSCGDVFLSHRGPCSSPACPFPWVGGEV